jgi:hypothetical protein
VKLSTLAILTGAEYKRSKTASAEGTRIPTNSPRVMRNVVIYILSIYAGIEQQKKNVVYSITDLLSTTMLSLS